MRYDPAQATVSITVVAELTVTTLTAKSSNATPTIADISTISGTLKDTNSNDLEDKTITLSITDPTGAITTQTQTTDANADYTHYACRVGDSRQSLSAGRAGLS